MSNPELSRDWLRRAESNLARLRAGKVAEKVLFEDLCYDAQQCVEKILKAVLVSRNIPYPKTHDIAYLFDVIEESSLIIPESIHDARILTEYAVELRYPGDHEPVSEEEYLRALVIAQSVYDWAIGFIG